MEKVIIGEILKTRIADMGFTQQEFADIMGMKKDTLRSYMNGSSAYSYELLIAFAEKLDCSYDYLLGYSKSPKREFHEVTEQTRLSEEAIEKIHKYAFHYDNEFEAKRYIELLDLLIREDGVLNTLFDYLIASRLVDEMYKSLVDVTNLMLSQHPTLKKLGVLNDYVQNLEEVQLVHVISELKDLKRKISQQSVDQIKRLDSYAEYIKQVETINKKLTIEEVG